MLEWHAVYRDDPQAEARTEERAPRAAVLKRFKDAATLGMHNGRAVIGMWLIDPDTEQEDPIAIHGRVPPSIRGQHMAYLARVAEEKPRR